MASGVQVAESARDIYQLVKMNLKGKKKQRFAVLKINKELTKIEVDDERPGSEDLDEQVQASDKASASPGDEKIMKRSEEFMELVKSLPLNDGRYILYDYLYKSSFGCSSKLVLIMWCPQEVNIKTRMLYASSKDALRKSFPDCAAEFQADCCDDLCHKEIEAKLNRV